MSTRPVKPPPKPGQVKVYKALYDFQASRPDELSFQEGDLLYIVDMTTNKDWWKAKCNNKEGLVPSNYIEENTESINPLHEAAKRGNIEFLKECVANRVSVNSLDKAGNTPLHWAAYGGHVECLNILLQSPNISIDVQNKLGDTPLHNAACKNHADVIRILLDRGARADLLNRDSKAPYDLAIDSQCKSLLQYSISADRDAQNIEYLEDANNDSD